MNKLSKLALLSLVPAGLVALSACAKTSSSTKTSSSSKAKVTLYYSAAASLKNALTDIDKDYAKTHQNVELNFDFAGSGAIRQKVVAGAPIDGVFLASKSDTDKLTAAGKAKDAQDLLGNTLVLIANKNSQITGSKLTDILSEKSVSKIAVGEPKTVPAGNYAEQSMTKLGDLEALKPKFVMASDVTQVLSYVANGNADLGFVYQTDALSNKNVKVLAKVPGDLHDKISYYTATVSASKHSQDVADFNAYLKSTTAKKVFEQYGFQVN